MGQDRSSGDLRGILVPDVRIASDNIVAKDDGTVPSTYTEDGPFAGKVTVSDGSGLEIRVSGTPTADSQTDILVQRSGGIELEGAGFVWRNPANGTDYYGVDGPAVVTGWYPLLWTTTAQGTETRPDVLRLASGRLLIAHSVNSAGVVVSRRFDPSDGSYTNTNFGPTGAGTGYLTKAHALVQLVSGRVLCFVTAYGDLQVDVYYSDDDGDNWTAGGYRILSEGADEALTGLRAAYSRETSEVMLLGTWANSSSGNNTAAQWASSDDGTAFSLIVNDWDDLTGEPIEDLDIVDMRGGGFCVLYAESATSNAYRRRVGSAFQAITSAERAEPDSSLIASPEELCMWRDEHDVLWFIVDCTSPSFMYRSLNQGDTWENVCSDTLILETMSATVGYTKLAAGSIAGRTAFVYRFAGGASSYDDKSVGLSWFSGYSSHTVPGAVSGTNTPVADDWTDASYIAWAGKSTNEKGGLWIPTDIPSSAVGTGSEALTADGENEITTTGDTRFYRTSTTGTDVPCTIAEFELEIDDGDGSQSDDQISSMIRWGGTTAQYEVSVRMSSSGFQLYDPNAAANVGGAQALDLTTLKKIRVVVDSDGKVRSWYCSESHYRDWSEGPSGSLTDGGSGTTHRIEFGHRANGANVSRWTMHGWSNWGYRWSTNQTDSIGNSWTNPEDLKPQSFSPSLALLHDGTKMQGLAGPGWLGDTVTIVPRYEHPVGALFPGDSPSPSRFWRATEDGQDYEIVIDLEEHGSSSFMESSSWGFFFLGSNLQSVSVDRWTGSSWATIGSADSRDGFSTLAYTRQGRILYPSSSSSSYWATHNMHAGDTLEIPAGESTVLREIASNAEGAWRTTTKKTYLRLDEIDGSEDASGNCSIRRRDFGFVTHHLQVHPRYIRFRIASQRVLGGKYKIGTIVAGPVFVFGKQFGIGWAWERASNTEIVTRDSGVRSSRVRGKLRRAAEISWADQAVDTSPMWGQDPNPDYLTGQTAGDPVASTVDTPYQILGLTERTEGGHLPVILLPKIPRGSGVHDYRQPQEFLYGRITTQDPSLDHAVGDDASSAVLRANRIRIEEEV